MAIPSGVRSSFAATCPCILRPTKIRARHSADNGATFPAIRGRIRMKAAFRITSLGVVLLLMALCIPLTAQQTIPTPTLLESYTGLPENLQDIGRIQQESRVNGLWRG